MSNTPTAPSPALMHALAETWPPAQRARFGAWEARFGAGGGRRVSALAGDAGAGLDADFNAALAQCAAWGQPGLAQTADPALDAALAARGWAAEAETVLMAVPVAALAGRNPRGQVIARVRTPLALLDRFWDEGGVGPARRAVMDRADAPKEKLLLRIEDRPGGALFVAASGKAAMVHALFAAPGLRRRGAGRAGVIAAADWALEQGCDTLAAAVEAENAAGRGFFDALGFTEAGRYRYRRAP